MAAHFCISFPCPLCNPGGYPMPSYHLPPAPISYPQGCICPPTSEKTCEAPLCPRKGLRSAVGGSRDG